MCPISDPTFEDETSTILDGPARSFNSLNTAEASVTFKNADVGVKLYSIFTVERIAT